ncbi:Acyl-CoA dehydrogenase [Rhodococcus rhodochrous J3]|uniref:Acyl-CoA dehydrogenase family protein n=2 Tax=Rhodococcus rhodochrous TaxID=1829 RepID=A0AA46WVG3_RHORH|nr:MULTISPECIES: acyl-CoA dehydrogenase family protein [Rhodococcus]AYA24469.1 acyl-CoA dehydrogenase [Rhodococcus rhodochrous]MBF4480446.1 acyl-CoA dehydrogenase family protein [Rhodococcus rhodochrous]MCB8911552.1 acyl-CoA dehydrogenase family protein [Rhodococcus rhodochrous]MCD2099724.1 acyl-CoA dehydrogenase family protein [Rhodococcus rhodochrous]MCD2124144.1 acyl-CoA dehydrogenase family protein [Rhodococcus rhodochrous]
MDFAQSERSRDYLERLRAFIAAEVTPVEQRLRAERRTTGEGRRDIDAAERWAVSPEFRELQRKARAEGLWNLFLPDAELGAGLSNVEYAPLAEEMGRSQFASAVFNCDAPDTGNMEVLYHYGSEAQKEQWLRPLLDGEIRSAFCMTEPEVASSDATNMAATAVVEGDEIVLNGRKWWSTGVGHPDCKVLIFMGLTDPEAHKYQRHSMVLVPFDTPGVEVERMLPTMGFFDEPSGHGEVSFTDVRLPLDAVIAGPGRGFEIAQGRLGPGRIHHCMRLVGLAEHTLELACRRGLERTAFGKPIINLGGNRERIADARIAINQLRLLVLHAAWLLDTQGLAGARSAVSEIKVVAPRVTQQIVDFAIQIHGGGGLSDDFPLAGAWTAARALRLADGPDEVHQGLVARFELGKYA